MTLKHLRFISFLFSLAILLNACASSRTTTTARTAVEQALISATAKDTVNHFVLDDQFLIRKTFYLDDSDFEAYDEKYMLNKLKQRLVELGMNQVNDSDDADILVYPTAAYAGIDDSGMLVGIPKIPLAIPGVGSTETPELALFKRDIQRGRARLGAYGILKDDGRLALLFPEEHSQHHYTRWTILVFARFRTTNLEKPF